MVRRAKKADVSLPPGIDKTGQALINYVLESESDMFSDKVSRFKKLAVLSKEYLVAFGCKIINPINSNYSDIKTHKDLIKFFYDTYRNTFPEDSIPYNSIVVDTPIAKHFINLRKEALNCSTERAIQDCAEIIDVLFKNSDIIPIRGYSFSIIDKHAFSWMVDAAIKIMMNNKHEEELKKHNQFNGLCNKCDKTPLGLINLMEK